MTALPLCRYLSPVVIVAGVNDTLLDSNSASTITIPAGTYYISGDNTATDLLKAIHDAAETATGNAWALTLSQTGIVTIECDASTQLDDDGFLLAVLGSAYTSISLTASTPAIFDYQHQYGWYASQPIEWDDGDDLGIAASQSRAKSGRIYTHQASEIVSDRPVRHAYESSYKAKELYSSGHENESFQAFWRSAIGECVRFYADASSASYVNKVLMGESLTGSKPARYHHGVPVYSWQVLLGAYV